MRHRQTKKRHSRDGHPLAFQNLRGLGFEPLEERRLLSVAIAGVQVASAAQQQTLADLPAAQQQAISSAIGADQSAYHATTGDPA